MCKLGGRVLFDRDVFQRTRVWRRSGRFVALLGLLLDLDLLFRGTEKRGERIRNVVDFCKLFIYTAERLPKD